MGPAVHAAVAKALRSLTMSTLAHEYRLADLAVPGKVTTGLDAFVDRVVGAVRRRGAVLANLRAEAERIDALADSYRTLSHAGLTEKLAECRLWFRRHGHGAEADTKLPEALAAVREAADRKVGLRP